MYELDVSIIMINYNTFNLTKTAIESIFAMTNGLKFEIILIDNCSIDNSGQEIKEIFKDKIIFIQNDSNLGTSKAFNIGCKISKGKYVLWLNTDTYIKMNFVKELFDFMEKNHNCGICGGNILDFNGNPNHSYRTFLPSINTMKKEFSITSKFFSKIFRKRKYDQFNYSNKPIEVGYITGADMMIRKKVFDEIGFFSDYIFMYAEETEFTYRMIQKTEYKVYNVPYAIIYHLEGASFKQKKFEFNEARLKRYLDGNCTYFKLCYGDEFVLKYLQILKKGYKKYYIIYKFINKGASLYYLRVYNYLRMYMYNGR